MIKLNVINETDYIIDVRHLKKIAKQASKELALTSKLSLNVLFTNNEMIYEYNLKYRNIDSETDVLSFPSDEKKELGDIIISLERAELQSKEYNHSLKREVSFLLTHGILHCMGYDHQTKEEETVMFNLQEKILEKAGISRND